MVLPKHVFIQSGITMYTSETQVTQDEDILHPWIDLHHLKKINGE
jgi:hypothetical protein